MLHSFTGVEDGSGPLAGLLLDSAGNLYGTTVNGGASGFAGSGVVFKLAGTGFVTTTLPIANAGPNQNCQDQSLVVGSLFVIAEEIIIEILRAG